MLASTCRNKSTFWSGIVLPLTCRWNMSCWKICCCSCCFGVHCFCQKEERNVTVFWHNKDEVTLLFPWHILNKHYDSYRWCWGKYILVKDLKALWISVNSERKLTLAHWLWLVTFLFSQLKFRMGQLIYKHTKRNLMGMLG